MERTLYPNVVAFQFRAPRRPTVRERSGTCRTRSQQDSQGFHRQKQNRPRI